MMGDGAHAVDMQLFHQLFAHRSAITRNVVMRPDGIETVTESMNPDLTRLLQAHVAPGRVGAVTLILIALGVLGTFPPVWGLL